MTEADQTDVEHFDVIVVGAGLSGIGAAHHLKTLAPDRSFVLLEGRERLGGTWDLFRYPGIRSDSDMFTLGYAFRPWRKDRAIAGGGSILRYLQETAREDGTDARIRYGHKVRAASWSSADARWTLDVDTADGRVTMTASFLHICAGYYNYDRGHAPAFAGAESFAGRIVHPQFWPEDLDHADQRVVVIGSGATAVTLVPALAERAAHVTMLQRSPTYVVSRPSQDRVANALRRHLPARLAYRLTRLRSIAYGIFSFHLIRRRPQRAKAAIVGMVARELGPDYDVTTHFTPSYDPWDQRLCLVPDADLFAAIRRGDASVVTDRVSRFTPHGILLESGAELPADIIVTATGLKLKLLGGIAVTVDGERVDFARTYSYKGTMFSDVPNLASTFGYTNASWTLKADLTATYLCRLLNTMRRRGVRQATPRLAGGPMAGEPLLSFTSGYVQRAIRRLPRQGDRGPWKLHQNYARDLLALKFGSIDNGMEFSNPVPGRTKRRREHEPA